MPELRKFGFFFAPNWIALTTLAVAKLLVNKYF